MNKKLIAAAVSAVVMAPVASQADTTVYGRINNAIDLNGTSSAEGAEATTDISGISSRFGAKASADIGNGLTANGKYEFATTTDKEGGGIDDTRIATVGLSGSFGSIDIGNQWSAYFDTVGTLISPTYTLGAAIYSGVGGGPYRTSNTIKYSNTFGRVYLELDYRLNGSNEDGDAAEVLRGDGYGIGLNLAVTKNITIAASIDSEGSAALEAIDAIDAIPAVAAIDAIPAVARQKDIVTFDYNPGNTERREAVTVDVLQADGTLLETTFVAVTTVNQGGGNIILADELATTDGVDKDGQVITPGDPGSAAVAAVDAVPAVPAVAAVPESDGPDTDRLGIAVNAKFGGYWASVGFQNQVVGENEREDIAEKDTTTTFLYVGGSLSEKTSWLVGLSQADDGSDVDEVEVEVDVVEEVVGIAAVVEVPGVGSETEADRRRGILAQAAVAAVEGSTTTTTTTTTTTYGDSSQITWGLYHSLGGGMKLYYEGASVTNEYKKLDGVRHVLGMRIDF